MQNTFPPLSINDDFSKFLGIKQINSSSHSDSLTSYGPWAPSGYEFYVLVKIGVNILQMGNYLEVQVGS